MKKRDYKLLLVVTEVDRQQLWMYQNNKQSIEDRIVSLTQPHIRPIVRGKAGKPVEFGAKFSASCIDGYIFLDRISGSSRFCVEGRRIGIIFQKYSLQSPA